MATNTINGMLSALYEQPGDILPWLAIADWLEEEGHYERAELVRLSRCAPDSVANQRRVQELLCAGVRPVVPEFTNSIGMRFALIPAGRFLMGSLSDEQYRQNDVEQHEVTITRPFYLGVFPVSQKEYEAVTGTNPSHFNSKTGGGPSHPVEQMSWHDAAAFCRKLAALKDEKREGRVYRLPTEAEWEYACRAGTTTPFAFGEDLSSTQANFDGTRPYGGADVGPFRQATTKVGTFAANAWGLYDMHGNVWEWCADWYTESPLQSRRSEEERFPGVPGRQLVRVRPELPFGGPLLELAGAPGLQPRLSRRPRSRCQGERMRPIKPKWEWVAIRCPECRWTSETTRDMVGRAHCGTCLIQRNKLVVAVRREEEEEGKV